MGWNGDVVIVGAGLAGVSAAAGLREHGHRGTITLVSAEPRLPYDRPPLSKSTLLDDPCPPEELLRPESFYAEHNIRLRLGTTVVRLDTATGTAELAGGGRLRADAVLLCSGGQPRMPDLPGVHLDGVCALRTAGDATQIRARLDRGCRVVVIGGGFIGTEVAAAAVSRGCPTVVIEADELPMLRALGPEVAARLLDIHQARGADIRTGTRVARIGGRDAVDRVELSDGTEVAADLVVVGVGLTPETHLAADAGLRVGDGVHVDASGRTSNPAIWAAGDVASVLGPDGTRRRTEHWQNAQDQGAALARAVLGAERPAAAVPWFWSDQYDLNIQLAGRPEPTDTRTWRGEPEACSFSVLHHRHGMVTGITAVNRGRDVRPAIELIRRSTVLDHTLLADPATTVKSLLKTAG